MRIHTYTFLTLCSLVCLFVCKLTKALSFFFLYYFFLFWERFISASKYFSICVNGNNQNRKKTRSKTSNKQEVIKANKRKIKKKEKKRLDNNSLAVKKKVTKSLQFCIFLDYYINEVGQERLVTRWQQYGRFKLWEFILFYGLV